MTEYFTLIINAVFTGLGTSVGSYLGAKYAIAHVQKMEEHLERVKEELRGSK